MSQQELISFDHCGMTYAVVCMCVVPCPLLQLHHSAVSLDRDDTITHIASLRPDSMSWSNVPDFMVPQVNTGASKAPDSKLRLDFTKAHKLASFSLQLN